MLFDAGISGVQAAMRLAAHGIDIRRVDAVVISHDHADHIRHAGVLQRKFGLPVYATPATISAAESRYNIGKLDDVRFFRSDGLIRFGGVTVHAIPTPHDGRDGAAFVVDDNDRRLGILTDLGHVFGNLVKVVSSLDAVFIESNYDPLMLAHGRYPASLKRRIKGPAGHLSNVEAAELLRDSAGDRLTWACLSHLSEENNHPSVALKTHREIVPENITLHVAGRYSATGIFTV